MLLKDVFKTNYLDRKEIGVGKGRYIYILHLKCLTNFWHIALLKKRHCYRKVFGFLKNETEKIEKGNPHLLTLQWARNQAQHFHIC